MTTPENSGGVNSKSWFNLLWIVGVACAILGGSVWFLFLALGGPIPGTGLVLICFTIICGIAGSTFVDLFALWSGAILSERHSIPFGMCLFGLPGPFIYFSLLKLTHNLMEYYPSIWLLPPLSFVLLLLLGILVGKLLVKKEVKYTRKARAWSIIFALLSLPVSGLYSYTELSNNFDSHLLVVTLIFLTFPLSLIGGAFGAVSAAFVAHIKKKISNQKHANIL